MKLPRDVSGDVLVRYLVKSWGYLHVHTVGSHFILRTQAPTPHTLSVPMHKPLKVGTPSAILQGVATHKGVARSELLRGLW